VKYEIKQSIQRNTTLSTNGEQSMGAEHNITMCIHTECISLT